MMNRYLLRVSVLFVLAALFLSAAVSTRAQDTTPTPNPDCNVAAFFEGLPAIKASGDVGKDLDTIRALRAAADTTIGLCGGLVFKGDKVPKIVGPIELASGSYKAILTSKGGAVFKPKLLSGACTGGKYDSDFAQGLAFFILGTGEADTGAETLIDSKGCKFLVATDDATAPWTLVFEKMD